MGFVKADWLAFTRCVETLTRDERPGLERGRRICLDVGGGTGPLREFVAARQYRYVNVDMRSVRGVNVVADVHWLPFESDSIDLVVSTNCLEHVTNAWKVIPEIHRVMKSGARLAALVPFLHPFHGDDVARFTAYGLRTLLAPLQVEAITVPTHIVTLIGLIPSAALQRLNLPTASAAVRDWSSMVDRWLTRRGLGFDSWAHSYLIVATKQNEITPSRR
jgi:ubiquinone/menaquinone biosynthesis C-methylase UbiE